METETRVMGAERAGEERVTPLELFFDLVFVLSFTQVTLKMADHPGWESLGEGLLILAAVWWAWCAYGWLTKSIDPDQNLNRDLQAILKLAPGFCSARRCSSSPACSTTAPAPRSESSRS